MALDDNVIIPARRKPGQPVAHPGHYRLSWQWRAPAPALPTLVGTSSSAGSAVRSTLPVPAGLAIGSSPVACF